MVSDKDKALWVQSHPESKSASERLVECGYEDVVILENYSYDDALIGVTDDNRAVYDFNKMVAWLMDKEEFSYDEAVE